MDAAYQKMVDTFTNSTVFGQARTLAEPTGDTITFRRYPPIGTNCEPLVEGKVPTRSDFIDEAAPISQEAYDALKPKAPCPVAPPVPKPTINMWYAKENLPVTCEYSPDFLQRVSRIPPHKWPTKGGSEFIRDMDAPHLKAVMNKIERSWPNESKCPQRIAAAHSRIRRRLNSR